MRVYHILLVVFQAAVLIRAADPPNSIKWTLHKSCYRDKEDTADDNDLADAMIKTVDNIKAWAKRGAEKLDDSISPNPTKGAATKNAMKHLIGSDNYKDKAKDVSNKFKALAKLDGPIGKGGDSGGKYDRSDAWRDLGNTDTHWWNVIIVCRPELVDIQNPSGFGEIPNDQIRDYPLFLGHDLKTMIDQEEEHDNWVDLPSNRIQAITSRDSTNPPQGNRKRVAESITFHPLWIKHQRDAGWEGWTAELFSQVTASNAREIFKQKSEGKGVDARPVDGVLNASFTRNMFHEMFHLTAFGRMIDDTAGAYLWVNNVKNKNRENPDLLAIIAAVIELLNKEGTRYKVSEEGIVSPR